MTISTVSWRIPGQASCVLPGGSVVLRTCMGLSVRPPTPARASQAPTSAMRAGGPTVNELVAEYLAQDPVRFIVAFGKVREGVLHRQDYFPFLMYFSNSSKGRQLITLPFSTQARLACETPYFMKPRARSSWASVSMVMLTPAPTASRT